MIFFEITVAIFDILTFRLISIGCWATLKSTWQSARSQLRQIRNKSAAVGYWWTGGRAASGAFWMRAQTGANQRRLPATRRSNWLWPRPQGGGAQIHLPSRGFSESFSFLRIPPLDLDEHKFAYLNLNMNTALPVFYANVCFFHFPLFLL